jgi:hypothetical protein
MVPKKFTLLISIVTYFVLYTINMAPVNTELKTLIPELQFLPSVHPEPVFLLQ